MTDRHAAYCGWVLGHAILAGLDVVPVLDGAGNYTDRLQLRGLPDGITVELVVPPPPADWALVVDDGPTARQAEVARSWGWDV